MINTKVLKKGRDASLQLGALVSIRSFGSLFAKFPHKVKIDIMGRIAKA